MKLVLILCSVTRGKLGMSLSSNVELQSKIKANSFVLSVEKDMTSGHSFFVSVYNLVGDLTEFLELDLFLFNLSLDYLRITTELQF